MRCFVVAGFLLTSASRGPSAIAEPLVIHGANGPESNTTLYFEEVRQVAVPVGHQTTTMFGRVHENAATGAKPAICDCLVYTATRSQRRCVVVGPRVLRSS